MRQCWLVKPGGILRLIYLSAITLAQIIMFTDLKSGYKELTNKYTFPLITVNNIMGV